MLFRSRFGRDTELERFGRDTELEREGGKEGGIRVAKLGQEEVMMCGVCK